MRLPQCPVTPGSVSQTGDQVLTSYKVGVLPTLNRVIARAKFENFMPVFMDADEHCAISPVIGTLVILKNYLVSRKSIHGVSEWACQYVPDLLGLSTSQLHRCKPLVLDGEWLEFLLIRADFWNWDPALVDDGVELRGRRIRVTAVFMDSLKVDEVYRRFIEKTFPGKVRVARDDGRPVPHWLEVGVSLNLHEPYFGMAYPRFLIVDFNEDGMTEVAVHDRAAGRTLRVLFDDR